MVEKKTASQTIKKVAKPKAKAVKAPAKTKSVVKAVKPEVKKIPKVVETVVAGKYIATVGRRKSAIAQVRLYTNGKGLVTVNGQPYQKYLDTLETAATVEAIMDKAGQDFDFSIKVSGGGRCGQADAIRHGIARALIIADPSLRPILKAEGWLSRDARIKERKKPGLKKARRAPQWSKR